MAKLGVLVHVYHLDARGWDVLTWGEPDKDSLGSFPTLAEVLLRRLQTDDVASIVLGSTSMRADDLSHGEYVKKYALDRFEDLTDFPRLQGLLDAATERERAQLRQLFGDITITPTIRHTADEIAAAADIFAQQGVQEVVQIAAASHAPRCLQLQLAARIEGVIPADQLWLLRATDTCYDGATPLSTAVFEPPHRGDDPLLGFEPKIADVLQPYHYALSPQNKKQLIKTIAKFIKEHQ